MFKKIYLLLLLGLAVSSVAHAADSLNVRTVGSWPFGYTYSAATCSIGGHHIAIVDNDGGIMTVNIDTPTNPYWLGEARITGQRTTDLLGHHRKARIYGNHAFLALAELGLCIIDISDPANPNICNQMSTPGYIVDIAVRGSYAYAADDSFGLRVVDVSDPFNPDTVALVPSTEGCYSLAINDTLLYIIKQNWPDFIPTVLSFNITTPNNPIFIDSLQYLCGGSLAIKDTLLLTGAMDVLNISNPADIFLITSFMLSGNGEIAIHDTLAFCPNVGGFAGLYITSFSDPANPYIITSYDTPGYTRDIYSDNNLLYVSDDIGGLRVIDISSPNTPIEIGAFNSPSPVYGNNVMLAKDDILYYPTGDLYSLDVSDPAEPHTTKWGKALGNAHAVALKDSIILTIDDAYGFKAMQDVGNKYLSVVDSLPMSSSNCWDIYCMDTLALVASSESLFVINVSDAGNIHIIGQCGIPNATSYAAAVTATSQYAYVAAGTSGFYIVDLSNLTNPEIVDTINIGMVWDLTIDKDILCLANDLNGLLLMNIDIPDSPKVLSVFDTSGKAMAITVDSLFAYLADDSAGLRIIDISEPTNPFETGYYAMETVSFPLNNRAVGVAVGNGNIFVSHYAAGLKVYKYYGPDAGISTDDHDKDINRPLTFLLKDAYPNPVRSKATISYQLPAKAEVKLNLYNITGQLVRSTDLGTQPPGYYNVPLKTDKLSSGVYFYKLTAGNDSQTRKLVILK